MNRAGVRGRVAGIALGLFLLLTTAIVTLVAAQATGDNPCDDILFGSSRECVKGSKVLTLVFGLPAAILAATACVMAFMFAISGRRSRPLILIASTAVVLSILSIAIAPRA